MFGYYINIAWRSFRRNKVLTALMICAIALGIGSSMTTQTVLYVLSDDPLPGKSATVFHVQLEPRQSEGFEPGGEPPEQLTRYDAEALLAAARAKRQAVMTGGDVAIEPTTAELSPFLAGARFTSADFFPMFDVPFRYGSAWNKAEDDSRARVAVISSELSEKLYGAKSPVGQSLRINEKDFQVIGVLDDWRATPHFYDLNTGRFRRVEEVFIPFATSTDLEFGHSGSMSCWDSDVKKQYALNAACVWVQFWVELGSQREVTAYHDFLAAYSDDQRAAGRFERPTNIRLRDVMGWLEYKKIVPGDVRLQAWLAFGFLLVCLLNTLGLMLATFMRRASEIGVRRALGAPRKAVFAQLLVEAGTVGVVGAAFGLGLVYAGLWAVRKQPTSYADLVHLDARMLILTVGLAVVASLVAAIIPAWRACTISPALQVKAQ